MNREEAEKQFERYREYLLQESQRLTCFIEIYRRLYEAGQEHQEALAYAPAFFDSVQGALFTSIVIWTDKLFDGKSKRGFPNFLSFVEN